MDARKTSRPAVGDSGRRCGVWLPRGPARPLRPSGTTCQSSLVCWAGQASLSQVSAGLCPPRGQPGAKGAAFCIAHPACTALGSCSGRVFGARF